METTSNNSHNSGITNKEQSEGLLLAKIKELESFFNLSLDLLCIADTDGNFIKVNKAWSDILGYNLEELERKKFLEFVHPEDLKATLDTISQLKKQKQVLNFTNRYRSKDGSYRYIEWRSHPHGKLIYAAARDITERKLAEDALKERERYLSAIIKTTSDGFWVVNMNGNHIDVNETYSRMSGYTKEEILQMHINDIDADETPEETRARIKRIIKNGSELFERRHRRKDGSIFDVEISASWLDGLIICFCRDITERKLAEESLINSESKFRAYTENAPLAITVSDNKGRFIEVNQAACQMSGYTKKELLNMSIVDFLAPEFREKGIAMFKKVNEQGFLEGEILGYTKNAERIWASLVTAKINDKTIIGFLLDITERKKYEERLQTSEKKYRQLFEMSPVSLWEEDFSEVKNVIDELKCQNIRDLYPYLLSKPPLVEKLASLVKVIDVNQATLKLYKAKNKEEFFSGITKVLSKVSYKNFIGASMSIAEGRTEFFTEDSHLTLDGDTIETQLRWNVMPGYEQDYSRILVSIVDFTKQKQIEAKLVQYNTELELKRKELEKVHYQLSEKLNKAFYLHSQFLAESFKNIKQAIITAHYKPAQYLGGDLYGVHELNNRILFYIVDISGHGLDGFILSIFIRENIRNYLSYHRENPREIEPHAIIEDVKERFYQESFPEEYYICMQVGIIDVKEQTVSFANAGIHICPIIVNEKIQQIETEGLPISKTIEIEKYEYATSTVSYKRGDTIFITTDGLIEEKREGKPYDIKRAKEVLASNYRLPPEVMKDKINEDFYDFTGTYQGQDDITYLVVNTDEILYNNLITINSTREAPGKVLKKVKLIIDQYSQDNKLFLMGIYEMLVNAVEHGNKFAPVKTVEIVLRVTEKYSYLSIKDQGEGFNWKNAVEKEYDFLSLDDRGRGIGLTKMFADCLSYNTTGNQVRLVKFK